MVIIDTHAHIYPEKIAEKATKVIGDFYDITMQNHIGTCANLINNGKKAGISKFVVHSCATKKEQVTHINDFIKSELDKYPEFIGYMTLHEDLTEEEIESEVSRCIKLGFKGIKLHPDFQKFNINSVQAEKIYNIVEDRLPILFHTGDDRVDYSRPFRLAEMAKKYKKVRFIAAHFGGYRRWNEATVYKGLENVYFDTCSSLPFMQKGMAEDIISMLGAERFFFGTDFPMWDAEEEIERVLELKVSDDVKDMIFAKNFKTFIGEK